MPITVDCGEGKCDLCPGTGHTAYLVPQESRSYDEPPFYCGHHCHHDGTGAPCRDPDCVGRIMTCTICDKPIGSTHTMIREHFTDMHPGVMAAIEGKMAARRAGGQQ